MNRSTRILPFLALVAFAMIPARAQYVTGQSASSVLGQTNFTGSFGGVTQTTLNRPGGVAVDPVSKAVFVADYNNSRILRYSSVEALATGAAASGVLGQPNFTSLTTTTTQSGLRTPYGIFVDAFGRLWVADTGNNRVLWFNNAANKADGANADGVVGQTNFTNFGTGLTATTLDSPQAVFVSPDGDLWIADSDNNRVLGYGNAVGPTGTVNLTTFNASATRALGKTNFTTGGATAGANGMSFPAGLAMDSAKTLWVADSSNNRVLGFLNAQATVMNNNGPAADRVLGQATTATTADATTSTGMHLPEGLLVDKRDNLYIADRANNRVLVQLVVTGKANGAAADRVLGAATFTDSFPSTSAVKFNNPTAIAIDANDQLFIADRLNNRVLRFPPVSIPVLKAGTGSALVRVKRAKKITFTLTNTNYPGAYVVKYPRSNANFTVSGSPGSGAATSVLPVGGVKTITITLRGKKPTKRAAKFTVTAQATATPFRSAAATTKVSVR